MSRTNTTFGLLQAIAIVAAIAVVLWSLGVPSIQFAQAENVTSFSNTLSDSAPSVASDHTITFATPSGVPNGGTITVDFSDGPFNISAIDFSDIDVYDDATLLTTAADCSGLDETSATTSGSVLTITFCSGNGAAIQENGTTTILIGHNAVGTTTNARIVNPGIGVYDINVTAGPDDIGTTKVAIIAPVTVQASVNTFFSFTIGGVGEGVNVNEVITTGTSSTTSIPFGTLVPGQATSSAQQLSVATNASYGFSVTVAVDRQLTSSSGADIDGFIEGTYTTTPTAWQAPVPNVNNENTWGHWGLTSNDETLPGDPFDVGGTGALFVSASTTPVEVFRHTGPADGTTQNVGTAQVAYQVEITSLQEAGSDYTATLTYVATPVF
jgi:hypothetical protein